MKNIREIGSEFCAVETLKHNELFFVSGRTALDFIIRDILAEHKITVAHLPSFCCHTMIDPFLKNNIPVRFYDVFYEDNLLQADIPELNENEIFFYIRYFGYTHQNMGSLPDIKKSGCIIIEDSTHSWLMTDKTDCENSLPDYKFTSYRKWTGFTGIASAIKFNNKFSISQNPVFNEKYEMLRKKSQEKKLAFLEFNKGDKQDFLNSFSTAEEILENDYANYMPSLKSLSDFISIDKNRIINTRRENAKILFDELSELTDIVPIFPRLDEHDTPLCVPVLIPANIRDEFRKYLVLQQIYCPIHWPLSSIHNKLSERSKNIYKSQLSLVCDQRYDANDMRRMINCIKSFFLK